MFKTYIQNFKFACFSIKEYLIFFKPMIRRVKRGKSAFNFNVAKFYPEYCGKDLYLFVYKNKTKIKLENIAIYEAISDQIRIHNNKLKEVKENIDLFYKNNILVNPLKFTKENLTTFENTYKTLLTYKKRDLFFERFIIDFVDVYENLELIQEQYNVYLKYKNLISKKDCFIDFDGKEELSNIYLSINQEFKSFAKRYYKITTPDFDRLVKENNDQYIKNHINDEFFNNINNHSLDEEQRKSVLTDEKANLIVAGAGSGKTLTIVGKTKYLIEKQNVSPSDILLLSYSKKSADDLSKKIKKINTNLKVSTFHKLGLDIIKQANNRNFVVEEQLESIVEKYFNEELEKNPIMMRKVLNYYSLFFNSTNDNEYFEDFGELYENLKTKDFQTLKDEIESLSPNIYKKQTLKKEHVKSVEELVIANFYFLNGIDYEYEKPFHINDSTMKKRRTLPDFYLKDYGVYHEHYGINREGKTPWLGKDASERYKETMLYKKDLYSSTGTTCIETYSYEFQEGTFFTNLIKSLHAVGIELNPISAKEIAKVHHDICLGQPFRSFKKLICSFISLFKARYNYVEEFDNLLDGFKTKSYNYVRARKFIEIAKEIYIYYKNYLKERDEIDFDDMIIKAKNQLSDLDDFKYKYIIVDEFQDISYSRMIFLKALINHGDSKLFAVGDDWQAIYRFSGCDLNIFTHFKDYFGVTETCKIQTTHRNSQDLQNIVGPFILKNPSQLKKTVKSDISFKYPVKAYFYDENKEDIFMHILGDIYNINPRASILILGRNSKDINDIFSSDFHSYKSRLICESYPTLKLFYSTVHSSKGLEEEYVILINVKDSKYGFPNKVEDDPILNLVLSEDDDFPYSEERRLWYVALTRTKNCVYLLVDKNRPSEFYLEIASHCENIDLTKSKNRSTKIIQCPSCKSGKLILRENSHDKSKFYGCSNYPYCSYTNAHLTIVEQNIRCPSCGGFMEIKQGRNCKYLYCTNRRCREKIFIRNKK